MDFREGEMTFLSTLAVIIGWECVKLICKAVIQAWLGIDNYMDHDPENDDLEDL